MTSARMRTRNCNPPEPTWVSRVEDALRTADDFLSVGEIVQRIQGSSNRVTAALCSLPPLPSRRLSGKRRQAVLVCDAADRHAHPPSRDAQTRRPRQSSCTPHNQRKENRAMVSRMQLMRRAVRLWKTRTWTARRPATISALGCAAWSGWEIDGCSQNPCTPATFVRRPPHEALHRPLRARASRLPHTRGVRNPREQ